ncbi:type I secretion outer membrane protein%2C TolC family [Bordetella ansorpii]|uniref:Type I secretion outer membrane protein, TolC family n=1 Tax=Bordetella ansorpii TaxID=288768 RepID=A0A157S6B6_9BORD|nr:TolC family protein [Bordetella ansorpii]SAI65476.1 type I secretion outer membrane protein%2C TolC family [Bordetella ansorpii]
MKRAYLITALLLVCAAAPVYGQSAGMPDTAAVRDLLSKDPAVAAATANLRVARNAAGILEDSPYEWTPSVSAQRRNAEGGERFNEWNVGVDRTIRLPGKAAADSDMAGGVLAEARASYRAAIHNSASELATLWIDWLHAEAARKLAQDNLQAVERGVQAVEKRVKAGDASRLDLGLAQAELADQNRQRLQAATLSDIAWSRLSLRFPGVLREAIELPQPLELPLDDGELRRRVIDYSEELDMTRAQLVQSQAAAARARAERFPDPTVGLFRASERGGAERYWGVRVSIPIPGGARFKRADQAAASADVSYQGLELKRRQLDANVASDIAAARGAMLTADVARQNAEMLAKNAALMQRAYTLGEVDLQGLLMARRQDLTAASSALAARTDALKASYKLLVDGHLIWDLERD